MLIISPCLEDCYATGTSLSTKLKKRNVSLCLEHTKGTAIDDCYHDMGHQGKKRTKSLISDQSWWPGVFEDVNRAVQDSRWCQLYRGREEKVPMVQMMVTAPLQLVHLDFTSFKTTKDLNESPKVEHILVIVDHFMRYTKAFVTKDQKASTAAKTLYKGFISIFGAPKRILMDQGKAFTSEVVELTVRDKPVNHYCISSPKKWSGGTSPPDL